MNELDKARERLTKWSAEWPYWKCTDGVVEAIRALLASEAKMREEVQGASRDHAHTSDIALDEAKETVRRALNAADNANHAGEQAVLQMALAVGPKSTDFGDIAAAAFNAIAGGHSHFDELEAHDQQFYINFAATAHLSSAKQVDVEGSRDELESRLQSSQAKAAEMREALKPFAACPDTVMVYDGKKHNEIAPNDDERASVFTITYGDIRRARTALGGTDEG